MTPRTAPPPHTAQALLSVQPIRSPPRSQSTRSPSLPPLSSIQPLNPTHTATHVQWMTSQPCSSSTHPTTPYRRSVLLLLSSMIRSASAVQHQATSRRPLTTVQISMAHPHRLQTEAMGLRQHKRRSPIWQPIALCPLACHPTASLLSTSGTSGTTTSTRRAVWRRIGLGE